MPKAKDTPKVCPIQKAAILLSDTWTMLIVRELLHGEKRFCELERGLESISTRTLTLKLKKLISEGIITKTSAGAYTVTSKGKGLRHIEKAMREYGRRYLT